jgi:hypothetical protein
MSTSWGLSLSIDAHGHDDTSVRTWPSRGPGLEHLVVRVGMVTVFCLDGDAATSAGLAWATARLKAREWLPDLESDHVPGPATSDHSYGGAFPAGSLILDGRQRWNVVPRSDSIAVTVGPLQVNVYDFTALDTHVRAWTEATALATRLFPNKAVPFNMLITQARRNALREVDRRIDKSSDAARRARARGRRDERGRN